MLRACEDDDVRLLRRYTRSNNRRTIRKPLHSALSQFDWFCSSTQKMVSVVRTTSSALFFSLYHSTRGLLATSSRFSRRSLFTSTSLVTAASFSFSSTVSAQANCENPRLSSTRRTMSTQAIAYMNAADASALDEELMSSPGFSLEQLMELAGLSVAEAVYQVLPPSYKKPNILLVCGPGNNGGDGLVAARHLVFFGYDCTIVYPKKSSQQHFINLVQQCKDVGVTFLGDMPADLASYDGIVDAIFGFSFKGEPREPFATALHQMIDAQIKGGVPVISVDVPSGWNVDEGDVAGTGFIPNALVSLTMPKESARKFNGRHFVGGRFLPPKLAEKYKVQMPHYPGVSQVVEVSNAAGKSLSTEQNESINGWEAKYAAYLKEKEAQLRETDPVAPPSNVAIQNKVEGEDDFSWQREYAEYCAAKEIRLAKKEALCSQKLKRTPNVA